ncbi:hypothetical protein B0H10DRAFT_2435276 [Mycena sp. CBHHK59/15]|nr:hypothetical protein B0H10DRAFT_2435276 [Mycena sp. CBHHK59/15]
MRFLLSWVTFYFYVGALAAGAPGFDLGRRVVPFKQKRSPFNGILPRSWKRELVPKRAVHLAYGAESYPSTALKFVAHANTPIILLEDIDYLIDTTTCHTQSGQYGAKVELNFRSNDAYLEALSSWSSYPTFILVTSHLTCNLDDRRGAWLITAVEGHKWYPQITLTAESVPLRKMAASFRISHSAHGVSSSWRPPNGLDARFDRVFSIGHDLDLAPRQQLFPLDSRLLQRSTDEVLDSAFSSGIQVFCVNCVSRTNFSVGIEIDVTDLGTKISSAHINVTAQQFEHDIQLEISLDGSVSFTKSVDVIKTALPDLGITIPDIGDIGFFYGGSVNAELDITGGLNFTIGAKTSVPAGATASFVMAGDGNSSATGWDGASFDLIPFRLNSGSFNATAQLSLSPFLEAEITLLKDFSASARIAVDTPQVTASASIESNVNRQCQPIGPNDFEFFSAALKFGAGASLQIQTTTNGSLLPDTDVAIFTHPVNFASFSSPDAPECFIVADDSAADSATLAGQVPSPTGTLRAAAVAVPSFDVRKIEAFFSASGALPTNVNYTQMAQATTIPSNLKAAIDSKVNEAGARSRLPQSLLVLSGVVFGAAACYW